MQKPNCQVKEIWATFSSISLKSQTIIHSVGIFTFWKTKQRFHPMEILQGHKGRTGEDNSPSQWQGAIWMNEVISHCKFYLKEKSLWGVWGTEHRLSSAPQMMSDILSFMEEKPKWRYIWGVLFFSLQTNIMLPFDVHYIIN